METRTVGENRHFVEIDLFIRQDRNDNLFRKYNEQQYKYVYDPEWIIEIVRKNGFEIIDTANNPDFGGKQSFLFIFKKL